MNNLLEKKNEIENFYDLKDESERDSLIQEIRNYSESKNEGEFIKEVRENFIQENFFSGINVIYVALNAYPTKWSNFFKEEYERAFEMAKTSDNAKDLLDSLDGISGVEKNKLKSRDEIIKILEKHLSSEKDVIRFTAIGYLEDWLLEDNKHKHSQVIQKIKEMLCDDNWRIRYAANSFLSDLNELPKGFKLSFKDRVKGMLQNRFDIN